MEFNRGALLETFAEESKEGLQSMEEGLSTLESRPDDEESLNAIFRSVHTLKGTAMSFGFEQLSRFAHVLEELLDGLRNGELRVASELVTLLFGAVDVLRKLVRRSIGGADELLVDEAALLESIVEASSGKSPEAESSDTAGIEANIPTVELGVDPDPMAHERSRSIRVGIEKLDRLLNLVGEISVSRRHVGQLLEGGASRESEVAAAHRDPEPLYEELEELAVQLRMVSIAPVFRQQIRVVRDLSRSLGKRVRLTIEGQDAEIDTSLMESLKDPLTHMIRNAVDHGIETPETREAAAKDPVGRITLRAKQDSGSIVIEVEDDGAGLDRARIRESARARTAQLDIDTFTNEEIDDLVFLAGLSTAESVSNVSGRGVGMDIVRRNIEALRGTVGITSRGGRGTIVSLRLPLTLAIIEGFQVAVSNNVFIIPLEHIVETVSFDGDGQNGALGSGVLNLRGTPLPYVRLRELLGMPATAPGRESLVVLNQGSRHEGVVVDALIGRSQTVIKPLDGILETAPGLSGSTVLGNGRVAFILDLPNLMRAQLWPGSPLEAERSNLPVNVN